MLEQQEPVAHPALGTVDHQALLERQSIPVADPAEPRRNDRPRLGGRPAPLGGQRLDRHDRTIAGRLRWPVRGLREPAR